MGLAATRHAGGAMTPPAITVYGAYWCPDCHRSKQFLGEHQNTPKED
jgi:hypothetical protein